MKSDDKDKMMFRPRATWMALGGAFFLFFLILGWWFTHSESDSSALRAVLSAQSDGVTNIAHQRPAPLFELKSSDGKLHRLEELRGNAVVVHFWASWCPPCLAEIPLWLEFAAQWRNKPVRFVAISLDKGWEDALKILPESQIPPNVLSILDSSLKLPDQFGTYQYPETYLLSRDLRIISKWVGPQNWNSPYISEAIAHALR